jgi:Glyoxalase/Bleomycin resistance protein/Dioxygenase superfamily
VTILGFGQRVGHIVQMAYVVADMHEAIDWWIKDTKTGPWFLLESFLAPDHVYRGHKSTADVKIAMAFAGNLCIELIQPCDDHPSVYKEIIDRSGYGFHHTGVACADVEAEIAAYEKRGYAMAFKARVPTGGTVAYMDNGRNDPGFLELIPATPGMDEMFTKYWRASLDWDGRDPIRRFG